MNKKIKIISFLILLIVIGTGIFLFFTKEDSKTTLTVNEKRWIEDNKNSIIDFATINGLPIVSNNGTGLIFDFINNLEKDTDLEFNEQSYIDTASSSYALVKKETKEKNDLLLYKDNYVLVSKENTYYTNLDELKDLNIGVLNQDSEKIEDFLAPSNSTFKTYENTTNMFEALKNEEVTAIAIPKLDYIEEILKEKMHIIYNIDEFQINYVITLGENETLNKILSKYFEKWKTNEYEISFKNLLARTYFTYSEVPEKDQTDLKSRRYTYGFVTNPPYDININGSVEGFNHAIISGFASSAGIEIDYKQYSSLENMINDFNSGEVDIISGSAEAENVFRTIPIYDSKIAIIGSNEIMLTLNSIASLKNSEVLVVKNTKTAKILKENNIKIKEKDNVQDIINNLKEDEIAAIDEYTYDYYVRDELKKYKNINTIDLNNNYGFITKDDSSFETLNNFLNYYLSFIDLKETVSGTYNNILKANTNSKGIQVILSGIVLILLAVALIITKLLFGKKKHIKIKLSKTDKLRYIDNLTSLKNRNYLNDNIAKWDSSEAYPQAVIIVDLNNIAYINDNFGHQEGDKVIVQAASILINHQLSSSEILRTNGNEFLIFSIGNDEKTIVTYMRKLNKEFKELSHGFGAAIGYSMITDEIKTIDDAINEATIDMKKYKEEIKS